MIEILAVAVGAVLGWGAGWGQQWLDRRRRRRNLASAMLLELRRIERNTRELAQSERAAWGVVNFPLGAHTQAMSQMDLFKPTTTAAIFDFVTNANDVQYQIEMILAGTFQRTEQRSWELRTRATYTANRIDSLKAALLDEGGQIVPERDLVKELSTYPKLLTLDPPAFPQPKVKTSRAVQAEECLVNRTDWRSRDTQRYAARDRRQLVRLAIDLAIADTVSEGYSRNRSDRPASP